MRFLNLCVLLAACAGEHNITYTYTPCETNDECPGVGGMCTENGLCAYMPRMDITIDVPAESNFDLCDGEDEDGDGEPDENDPTVGRSCIGVMEGAAVAGVSVCNEGALACRPYCHDTEMCGDGVDNDCNGLVDCADQTCARLADCDPVCVEDRNCGSFACIGGVCAGPPQWCIYGVDEDGDGYSPALAAEGCALDCDDTDANAFPEGVEACDNGRDDDCDTLADALDPDCQCSAPAALITGEIVDAATAPLFTLSNDSPSSGPIDDDPALVLRFEIRMACDAPVHLNGFTIRATWSDQLAAGWQPQNIRVNAGSDFGGWGTLTPMPLNMEGPPEPTDISHTFLFDFRISADYLLLPNTVYFFEVYAELTDTSSEYQDVLQFSVKAPINWCAAPDTGETCYETQVNVSEQAPIGNWLFL